VVYTRISAHSRGRYKNGFALSPLFYYAPAEP
jgi:hypothetical protein